MTEHFLVARDALAESQVADNQVVLAAKGNGAAVKHDAVAGRGLPGQGEIAADGDIGFQADDAADIEHDDAMGFAHSIAEGTGTGIGQGGDVNDFAAASAGGELAEAFRARKGQRWLARLRETPTAQKQHKNKKDRDQWFHALGFYPIVGTRRK